MKKITFAERVYALCKQIPRGKVTTYNEIAKKLNSSPRAVGQALKRNFYAPEVPCHRVIKSDGSIGGFKGSWNNAPKICLLREERIEVIHGRINLNEYLFEF